MPFILRIDPCKKCGESNKLTRNRYNYQNNVSGLHIWNNLQLIPAKENYSKKNKWLVGGL